MGTHDTTARRMALAGTLALGGALLLASARPAAAIAFITHCDYPITMPGTYVLAKDLNDCPLTGVKVQASNVNLILVGHNITTRSPSLVGIQVNPSPAVPLTGVKVEGGTITGSFAFGIDVENASGVLISGTTVSGPLISTTVS